MGELHFPWLELAIAVPLAGALLVQAARDARTARLVAGLVALVALLLTVGEWLDFLLLDRFEAHEQSPWLRWAGLEEVLVVDELTAPLLPLVALIHFLTIVSTPLNKAQRFSFGWTLATEALTLATFSCRASWWLVGWLVAGMIAPWLELGRRGASPRVFALHMGLFAAALIAGWALVQGGGPRLAPLAVALLTLAALLRNGTVPLHCWTSDLFEKATFGTAILFVAPLTGALMVMRLVLPLAPAWALQSVAVLSVVTAVYAAGMALVQTEARRFFCYLFLSHSSLVLAGLELATPLGLCGALSVWISATLSLGGFGLVLRCVESRIGRISLEDFHGLYGQMPMLAGFFLLTGLASIGFPGTVGFIAMELLVEGVVEVWPWIGAGVVITAALNGIAVLKVWFRIFTARNREELVSLGVRWPEQLAVMVLTLLILCGGLWPQPGVDSRYHAAVELLDHRGGSAGQSFGRKGNPQNVSRSGSPPDSCRQPAFPGVRPGATVEVHSAMKGNFDGDH
jgi:NADH-quinone oxidoreductase subunit M